MTRRTALALLLTAAGVPFVADNAPVAETPSHAVTLGDLNAPRDLVWHLDRVSALVLEWKGERHTIPLQDLWDALSS